VAWWRLSTIAALAQADRNGRVADSWMCDKCQISKWRRLAPSAASSSGTRSLLELLARRRIEHDRAQRRAAIFERALGQG